MSDYSNGDFGGCIHQLSGAEAIAFSVRPSLRLWRCDISGTVLITHMYKDLVCSTRHVKLHGEATNVSEYYILLD